MQQDARSEHPDIERLIDLAWQLRHDDTRRARGAAERALALARTRADARGAAWAGLRLALCEHVLGHAHGDYELRLGDGIAAMRQLGDARGEAEAMNLLANILSSRGEHEAALQLHRRCLALRQTLGDAEGASGSLNNAGIALRAMGRYDEAEASLREAMAMARDCSSADSLAYALLNLGHLALARAKEADAARHFEQAYAAATRTKDRALECSALTGQAKARTRQGDVDAANVLLDSAQALARRTGNVGDAARVNLARAGLELQCGRGLAAEPHLHAALAAARRSQDHELEAEVQQAFESLRARDTTA